MSTMGDAVVDLEKGTAALKEVEKDEELATMDPRIAKLVNRIMVTLLILFPLTRYRSMEFLPRLNTLYLLIINIISSNFTLKKERR